MDMEQRPIFKHAVMGGTFDRFHAGHKFFLGMATDLAIKVGVGITTPEYLNRFGSRKSAKELIQSFQERKVNVEAFLQAHAMTWYTCPLSDKHGFAATDESVDCIFVSEETYATALKINEIRQEKGFQLLSILIIGYACDRDGEIVASSHIRETEQRNQAA